MCKYITNRNIGYKTVLGFMLSLYSGIHMFSGLRELTGVSSGAGNTYHSGALAFTCKHGVRVAQPLVFFVVFCRWLWTFFTASDFPFDIFKILFILFYVRSCWLFFNLIFYLFGVIICYLVIYIKLLFLIFYSIVIGAKTENCCSFWLNLQSI